MELVLQEYKVLYLHEELVYGGSVWNQLGSKNNAIEIGVFQSALMGRVLLIYCTFAYVLYYNTFINTINKPNFQSKSEIFCYVVSNALLV